MLPLRFALRELRGGLRGFYVFITCIALGSMAIAGVGSLAASLADGLARQGQVILGGDLAFTLIQRELSPNERAFLEEHGKVSSAATMRAMAREPDGKATLVLVTHDAALATRCGRIVRLRSGRVDKLSYTSPSKGEVGERSSPGGGRLET